MPKPWFAKLVARQGTTMVASKQENFGNCPLQMPKNDISWSFEISYRLSKLQLWRFGYPNPWGWQSQPDNSPGWEKSVLVYSMDKVDYNTSLH